MHSLQLDSFLPRVMIKSERDWKLEINQCKQPSILTKHMLSLTPSTLWTGDQPRKAHREVLGKVGANRQVTTGGTWHQKWNCFHAWFKNTNFLSCNWRMYHTRKCYVGTLNCFTQEFSAVKIQRLAEAAACIYPAGNITKSENHCLILNSKRGSSKQSCNTNNNDITNCPQVVSDVVQHEDQSQSIVASAL